MILRKTKEILMKQFLLYVCNNVGLAVRTSLVSVISLDHSWYYPFMAATQKGSFVLKWNRFCSNLAVIQKSGLFCNHIQQIPLFGCVVKITKVSSNVTPVFLFSAKTFNLGTDVLNVQPEPTVKIRCRLELVGKEIHSLKKQTVRVGDAVP